VGSKGIQFRSSATGFDEEAEEGHNEIIMVDSSVTQMSFESYRKRARKIGNQFEMKMLSLEMVDQQLYNLSQMSPSETISSLMKPENIPGILQQLDMESSALQKELTQLRSMLEETIEKMNEHPQKDEIVYRHHLAKLNQSSQAFTKLKLKIQTSKERVHMFLLTSWK